MNQVLVLCLKILVFSSFYDVGYENLTITFLWLDPILGVHTFIPYIGCEITNNVFYYVTEVDCILNSFIVY